MRTVHVSHLILYVGTRQGRGSPLSFKCGCLPGSLAFLSIDFWATFLSIQFWSRVLVWWGLTLHWSLPLTSIWLALHRVDDGGGVTVIVFPGNALPCV
jgi:hypothetical protein